MPLCGLRDALKNDRPQDYVNVVAMAFRFQSSLSDHWTKGGEAFAREFNNSEALKGTFQQAALCNIGLPHIVAELALVLDRDRIFELKMYAESKLF